MEFRLKRYERIIVLIVGIMALSCSAEPLWKSYESDFLIGAAVGGRNIAQLLENPKKDLIQVKNLLSQEFNSVTADNNMKWEYLQPRKGQFKFDKTDVLVDWAEENGKAVAGHVLVWHSQTPKWVFRDGWGQASREVLIERMRQHIHTVVGRYKGRIKYWDVVNEAVLVRDGVAVFRDSPWRKIIGDDYIELAFRFAHEADPEAHLIYNDYNMNDLRKAKFVANMVNELRSKGVPVHGIGMQGHWHLEYPSAKELDEVIHVLKRTGTKISITELDLSVLPSPGDYRGADLGKSIEHQEKLNPYRNEAPEDVIQEQAKKYKDLFQVFLDHSEAIERVTFWGISDKYSWKNNFPVRGRTDYPLLFDRDHKPKPAYHALQDLKINNFSGEVDKNRNDPLGRLSYFVLINE